MMISNDKLLEIWSELSPLEDYEYTYKKIDQTSSTDLNIGINSKSMKCIVMVLPENFTKLNIKTVFKPFEMENIEFDFHQSRLAILLLKDESYLEEFLEFIMTLITKIAPCNEYESPSVFMKTLNDWIAMFKQKRKGNLSVEALLGLLAELNILKRELNSCSSEINSILKGWKGPYGFSKDFEFSDRFIEVKYTGKNKDVVRINSEHQLDGEHERKPLELIIVIGEEDEINGENLSSLNMSIRKNIRNLNGDLNLYLKALSQLGIKQNDMKKYDFIKISFTEIVVYDASSPYFPSIKKSNLDDAVSKVEYNLALNSLEKYISLRELL